MKVYLFLILITVLIGSQLIANAQAKRGQQPLTANPLLESNLP